MKFIFYLLAIFAILNSTAFIISINLKEKSSTSTDTSIMEFLNNLYEAQRAPKSTKKTKAVPKKVISEPQNQLVPQESELELLKEGWLSVSSRTFTNENIFPRLIKPDFSSDYIDVKENTSFRVNNNFNEAKEKDANFPPTKFSFYFRISKRNLWYTFGKNNIDALGSIPLEQIVNAEEKKQKSKESTGKYCLFVRDQGVAKWELCSKNAKDRREWMCIIKEAKNIPDDRCQPAEIKKVALADVPTTEFERKVSQPIILIPQPNKFCNEEWNYSASGADWECDCTEGLEQSPINIQTKTVVESPVVPVFTYTEVEVKKVETTSSGQTKRHKYVRMKNKHKLLYIKADSFGSVVTLDGTSYNADKIIFHTPAEHTIDGKKYPMEMEIIHTGISEGAITKHVILSFLFEKAPGIYNKFLDDVDFFNLPNPIAGEKKMENDLYIPKIFYTSDEEDLPIMKPFSLYTYQGSLSSPPCTEGTIRYIASDPIQIGQTAITLFQEAIRMPDLRASNGDVIVSTDSDQNARKIMPLNGRNIYYFRVPKDQLKALKKEVSPPVKVGHYEKVIKKINNYYFVNNDKPSGMPGALVVSEEEAKGQ